MRFYSLRLIVYSLLLALGVISCSKNDPSPTACYLKSASTTGTIVYSETMSYNDKMQVIGIATASGVNSAMATYTYATNGNLATADFGDGTTGTYTFDGQNRITHWELSPAGYTWDYTYNGNSQHSTTTFTDPACSTCGYTVTYAYANATTNNYSTEVFVSSTDNYNVNFEYDNQPNPYKLVLWSSTGTDNNITKQVIVPVGPTITTTYSYQYSDKGYPTSKISSDGSRTTYTYECK
jgi:hypothetical protein